MSAGTREPVDKLARDFGAKWWKVNPIPQMLVPRSSFQPMRCTILFLALATTTIQAQPNILQWVIGNSTTATAEVYQCEDLMWKITSMDEGTRLSFEKDDLFFQVVGNEQGVITVAAGAYCSDAVPSRDQSALVMVTAPVNIFPGSRINFHCPRGTYVRIDRYLK